MSCVFTCEEVCTYTLDEKMEKWNFDFDPKSAVSIVSLSKRVLTVTTLVIFGS